MHRRFVGRRILAVGYAGCLREADWLEAETLDLPQRFVPVARVEGTLGEGAVALHGFVGERRHRRRRHQGAVRLRGAGGGFTSGA